MYLLVLHWDSESLQSEKTHIHAIIKSEPLDEDQTAHILNSVNQI
jgi:hypothetical protein